MKLLAHQTGNLMNKNEISSRLSIDVRTLERYLYILSRSYHLRLVTPYSRHIRTELTRMPKIYFYDTGIRNMLMNSFEPLIIRADSGSLLENIVLSVLMHRHPTEDIHFWRTQGGQEIDFIIPDIHKAYEVKTDISRYSEKRYSTFLEKYPDIELVPIDMRLSMGDI